MIFNGQTYDNKNILIKFRKNIQAYIMKKSMPKTITFSSKNAMVSWTLNHIEI